MSYDLNIMVKKYAVKKDHMIKRICEPINRCLGVNYCVYLFIDNDGCCGQLSNDPGHLEFFYNEKLFLTHPLMVHPNLLRTGCAFVPAFNNKKFLKICRQKFQVSDLFVMSQKTEKGIEYFAFSTLSEHPNNCAQFFLNHLDLFTKFASYFKTETKDLISNLRGDNYSLEKAKGDLFFKSDPSWPLQGNNPKILRFLKTISSLSERESQCVALYKLGHSAQSTAALLKISQRTVETHFENIKIKLNCSSKRDLLIL